MRAVRPFDAGPPLRSAADIAGHDNGGHLIAEAVVDRHRGVLEANHAVHHRGHRLACDFRVAVGHRHRGFFVDAGNELGLRVHAVIDEGFLQAAEG